MKKSSSTNAKTKGDVTTASSAKNSEKKKEKKPSTRLDLSKKKEEGKSPETISQDTKQKTPSDKATSKKTSATSSSKSSSKVKKKSSPKPSKKEEELKKSKTDVSQPVSQETISSDISEKKSPSREPSKEKEGIRNKLSKAIHGLETGSVVVPDADTKSTKKTPSPRHKSAVKQTVSDLPPVKEKTEEISPTAERASEATITEQPPTTIAQQPQPIPKVFAKKIISINEFDTYKDFSTKLGVSVTDVIKKALSLGSIITINQKVDKVLCEILCAEYNCEAKFISLSVPSPSQRAEEILKNKTQGAIPRPPVVTVMGHVDHGKTTLLDTIRHSNIAAGEHGGITQHIGAYKVKTPRGVVVFLDTPGHEAFTALRARGSKITDIVVLVVSAVDGVMPQTIEAINHARAAKVPIVVAINKIDIQGANPERIKSELNQYKLTPEEWGGDTLMVEISARNNINIDKLLEAIHLQSEMLELKCDPNAPAIGAVVESRLDTKRGPLVTFLVRNGTLKVGDVFVAGSAYGKVRAMFDENGNSIRVAEPSTPALILGAAELPYPGDSFYIVKNEREARQITEEIKSAIRSARSIPPTITSATNIENLLSLSEDADNKQKEEKVLRLILKADVAGSLEAIRDHIERIEHPEFRVQIVHSGVGQVNESDVNLAKTTGSVIICFNVKADSSSQALAERYKVDIRTYRVVYELFSDIKKALEGLLEPKIEETVIGKAIVRKKFVVTKVGAVAGSYVSEGKILRGAKARVIRDGAIVYDGKIGSLRRIKEDVNSVEKGYECGITLENFQDVKENDIIEAYTVEKVKRLL